MSPFADLAQPLPTTAAHWHAVAMHAAGQILIDDMRRCGLLTGGPAVDRARCDELIVLAAAQGIEVTVSQATNAGIAFYAGWNDEPGVLDGVGTATLKVCATETCDMTLREFAALDPSERAARVDVLDELASRWAAEIAGAASTATDPRDLQALDRVRWRLREELSR